MRTALVTGGGRGIGSAIVEVLSQEGYRVIYTYRESLGHQEHDKIIPLQLDITDSEACQRFLDVLDKKYSFPEILVNNAGIVADTMFHKMTYDVWERVITTNLLSIFHLTQPIFTRMREQRFGRIVNISSVNANKGQAGQTNYCAAKAGIQGFTRALALEGARYGVTVNAVSPGYVATDMVMNIPEDIRNKIMTAIPLMRFGTPNEIAMLIKYLISDEAAFVTGANFEINGGMHFS